MTRTTTFVVDGILYIDPDHSCDSSQFVRPIFQLLLDNLYGNIEDPDRWEFGSSAAHYYANRVEA